MHDINLSTTTITSESRLWATTDELADRYRLSAKTVRNWSKKRILPCVRRGRVVRFHVPTCDASLKALESQSLYLN